jgi:hypothetical protein
VQRSQPSVLVLLDARDTCLPVLDSERTGPFAQEGPQQRGIEVVTVLHLEWKVLGRLRTLARGREHGIEVEDVRPGLDVEAKAPGQAVHEERPRRVHIELRREWMRVARAARPG